MRDTVIAAAIIVAAALTGGGAALSGRWHVSTAIAGAFTHTVVVDAWTGKIRTCLTSEQRTVCAPESPL